MRRVHLHGRLPWPLALPGRAVAFLGPGAGAARQSLVTLVLNSSTSLVAGALLGSITGIFEDLPGLLILVPAAIGLRGNVFSSLGSRLSTTIHSGTYRFSLRPRTPVGQQVLAAAALTASMSLLLALVAKAVAVAFGLPGTISVLELALISVLGGILASIPVLGATLAMTAGSARYGWDLDNIVAPLVSTLGDVLTLPALLLATKLVGIRVVTNTAGALLVVLGLVTLVGGWQSRGEVVRRVVRESVPVLAAAAVLSALAGVVLEKRLAALTTFPALLVLVPAFVSSAGALGGILSGRIATKLHLGTTRPAAFPDRAARYDGMLVALIGLPVYAFNGLGAHVVARLLGQASPGLDRMLVASLAGGVVATAFVVAVAYYTAVAAARVGLDPDNYAIPIVTGSVDFLGAATLIGVAVAIGIA